MRGCSTAIRYFECWWLSSDAYWTNQEQLEVARLMHLAGHLGIYLRLSSWHPGVVSTLTFHGETSALHRLPNYIRAMDAAQKLLTLVLGSVSLKRQYNYCSTNRCADLTVTYGFQAAVTLVCRSIWRCTSAHFRSFRAPDSQRSLIYGTGITGMSRPSPPPVGWCLWLTPI